MKTSARRLPRFRALSIPALAVAMVVSPCAPLFAAEESSAGKGQGVASPVERKVLMIGNSFSISVMKDLPSIVASEAGCKLQIMSLYIGGCSLARHAANIRAAEENPGKGRYSMTSSGFDTAMKGPRSIQEALQAAEWDVVTIQQASHLSWDYTNYQPHAGFVIGTIRRLAPQAEILIQHTWAYNAADSRIRPGGKWGFDQAGMDLRVSEAYGRLAREYGFRTIPTGPAVAAAREAGLPDVVGRGGDTIHLNRRGEYLQGCVWFAVLFGRSPETITYVPKGFDPEEAKSLRKCAAEAFAAVRGKKR